MQFTKRDNQLQRILCEKVRALTLRQIAHEFFSGDMANANRRLRTLVTSGVLVRRKLIVRCLPATTSPLQTWTPGQSAPNFFGLAHRVSKRWLSLPTRPTVVFMSASRFASAVGRRAKGKLTHPLQLSHDLCLSAVYLHFRRTQPQLARKWRGEDCATASCSRSGAKPDAWIVNDSNIPELAIEVGGVYSAKRLEKFHRHCLARSLPYEIW